MRRTENRAKNRNTLRKLNPSADPLFTGAWLEKIDRSFELLFEGEKHGRYSIIRPDKMARTVYVFIKAGRKARRTLAEKDIRVMWGSEYGLSDDYLRLETLEPSYTGIFVDAINS